MSGRLILGALLILVGGIVLARGLSYTSRHDVLDIGVARISTDEKKPVPPWIGGVAALAGLVIIFSGTAKKR